MSDHLNPHPPQKKCLLDIAQSVEILVGEAIHFADLLAQGQMENAKFIPYLLQRQYRLSQTDTFATGCDENPKTSAPARGMAGLSEDYVMELGLMDRQLRDWYQYSVLGLFGLLIKKKTWSVASEPERLSLEWLKACYSKATGIGFEDYPSVHENYDTLPDIVCLFFPQDPLSPGFSAAGLLEDLDDPEGLAERHFDLFSDLQGPLELAPAEKWRPLKTANQVLLRTLLPFALDEVPELYLPMRAAVGIVHPLKQARKKAAEANIMARHFLQKHRRREKTNPVSLRELAKALECSEGLVSSLPVWQALMEKRQKLKQVSKKPKAVSLTEKVLATAGNEDDALQRLLAEQARDFEPSPLEQTNQTPKERKRV
jgi:hypothetical protein